MRRTISILGAVALFALAIAGPSSAEQFGFKDLSMSFTNEDGTTALEAGSHPFAQTTTINPNTEVVPGLGKIPAGQPREITIQLPPGFVGSPDATKQCDMAHFLTPVGFLGGLVVLPSCPDASAVGLAVARGSTGGTDAEIPTPIYNLTPPPGKAARIGFQVTLTGAVIVDLALNESPPYNVVVSSQNITQMQRFYGIDATVWADPGSPAHDDDRGLCGAGFGEGEEAGADAGDFLGITCPVSMPAIPFITLPRRCAGPLLTTFESISWQGALATGSAETKDAAGNGVSGCERLGFEPSISSSTTSRSTSSPSGLDFGLDIENEGLTRVDQVSNSDLKKAVVTLPEGVTVNPSQAEGLSVCSESDFKREKSDSAFGAGCPAASKIGTVEVETPLLENTLLRGSLFVAEPNKNRFGTLIALYMTIKEPQLGINVGLAGKVEPDPKTGQLIATFDDLPQLPFSHFRLHFREGGRSPLITPPHCGTYTTKALFTPWANPASQIPAAASFTIDHGVGGGPCPPGGTPPFQPGFEAGSASNDAGSYSPFSMKLTRRDGDQDLTKFSTVLPLGMTAKLAGVDKCPDAQIAKAKAKTGKAELASPSCPANSQIGEAIGGAGAGSQLTYVNGKVYLAGPYHGAPLSVVAIVPAVAGPFDVGTIVTQFALQINPRTAEVNVDGDRSDPIPHILAGIPLEVRDIRANVNRPNFTLNPTSCDRKSVAAQIWGGGANPFSAADDSPVARSARYQASNCARLGFKPTLNLKLKGGTKRGAHPALKGTYRPRPGDANLEELVLRLPHSAFLDQAHIRTICTRVQFAADNCPKGAIYGHVKAITPLLSEPLQGPVYLRSSNHNLPDLVFVLHGLVDFEAVARIDSFHGGIRATFTELPDAPITEVLVNMQGGKKGLIINSTDLCAQKRHADVQTSAHSGKAYDFEPPLKTSCKKR